jgi:hypothetical protein
MDTRIRCFLLVPTGLTRVSLRRYETVPGKPCGDRSFHSAETPVGDMAEKFKNTKDDGRMLVVPIATPHKHDPRWPSACECGRAFSKKAEYQVFTRTLMTRTDSDAVMTLDDAPVGAMWDAWWYRQHGPAWWYRQHGPDAFSFWSPVDGMNLMVKTPGGEWYVDGRANNCDQPDRPHRCWVRHGVPPDITVDKNGDTCGAGAGSIQARQYHGFLRGGFLETC